MTASFNWILEEKLLEKLTILSNKKGESLDILITEAVERYLENQIIEPENTTDDPLIGLYKGSPELATQSEEILQQEIQSLSGWSWKNIQP